jgi:hypothetical protein
MIKEEILREEEAKRFPKPLFVLDLVPGKNGGLIPKYSTVPSEIVSRVRGVFEEGVKVLTEIPQLEQHLLPKLFKSNTAKNIKAPIIPPKKPQIPDKSVKNSIVDENAWLYYSFEEIIDAMERAVEPLEAFVQTFSAF